MIKDETIKWKTLHYGQMRPYADSIYEFEIETTMYETKAKLFCTCFLHPSKQEHNGRFDGSCSFPFGLNSYFKFKKISEGKYHYIVCEPYTG